ncbi:MAG: imidazolonepropionase [Armatimonadetes bacterium]|nr:MAG: imidazolonepropionase [Armatimonadota bacterium]
MSDLLITNIGQLVTNDGRDDDLLGIITDAAVGIRGGVIAWVGSTDAIPTELGTLPMIDAGGIAIVPGFVDAHTHVVFAGDRAHEHAMRLAGATYEEIQTAGGGIYSTVAATRAANLAELVLGSRGRVARMLASGTTTVEIKTGYGLDTETELKMIDALDAIDASLPIDVIRTFLGAHVVAPEYRDDRSAYVDLVAGEMLDAVSDRVDFIDVFCDDVAFSLAETERIIEAGRAAGLPIRLHVDQLSRSGGAALAASVGAVAADHLDHATDADLASLAAAGTVAVLLPGVSLTMQEAPPDGRRFLDAGVTVAIATDCNPGTSYVETMPFIIALAATTSGFTPQEALWSATAGGAAALGLDDRGVIAEGKLGDLVMLNASSYEHLVYRPDGEVVRRVIKRGTPV